MIHFGANEAPSLPVLMYHDVSIALKGVHRYGLPNYYCTSPELFREQLRALQANEYRAVLYHDAPHVRKDKKVVLITFDDGWKGNVRYAVPILREFGFTAVFFVTVGSIGSQDYMNWDDLQRLLDAGMCVQSHGMNHRPLEDLDPMQLESELSESKTILERRLGATVDAISFPHGSYNMNVITRAAAVGFQFFFTSDISPTYTKSFLNDPRRLARIPMTNKVTPEMLIKMCQYRGIEYYRGYLTSRIKKSLRRAIGIDNYRFIYRKIYRIYSRENIGG